ncbi:MAG: D-tyrosyl-tRNA(Tyr) deacylase [Acidobacteria bacterium]|nr:D-tyrosyl-tRNA(Tyr) deacylase [Acidobacteriota bacterium]
MRLILQRVKEARVRVEDQVVGRVGRGLLVFAGVVIGDGTEQVDAAVEKLARLRVFEDEAGKMNLDAAAAGAGFLVVSQFTLAASLDRGRRPSFDRAAPPAVAAPLIDRLVTGLRERGFAVEEGSFGAHMAVELINDGPVTFVLDLEP